MTRAATHSKPRLSELGGIKGFLRNPGLAIMTLRRGSFVGKDSQGNCYFEERVGDTHGRKRRWVVYAGPADASVIGPEWHAWLHHISDQVLPDSGRRPWQKPHLPNLTGTPESYRPAGHDYAGGRRAKASGDYQSWTPDL